MPSAPREALQFLPALLEIERTPPPAARWMLRAVMLLFGAAGAWACVGRVDVVATAGGRIVPDGRVKVVQPFESGVIRAILVRDGERVAPGQALIEIDATQARADLDRLRQEALALETDRARLSTLLDAGGTDARSAGAAMEESFRARLSGVPDRSRARSAVRRMREEWREYRAGLEDVDQRHSQRRAEAAVVAERIRQIDATLPLIAERADSLAALLRRRLVPRAQWLELEQQRLERVKERDVQTRQLAVLEAAGAALDREREARDAGARRGWSSDLEDAERRLAALAAETLKAERRVALQTLTAPVAGTVQRLAVHTPGGVVTPAQELLQIVPGDGALEIEAWVLNRDVGFVRAGQAVAVKVEAFPFTRYGTLDGELTDVSADAVPDDRLGPVYSARVRLSRQSMPVDGKEVPLAPGMAVTAEFRLGSRRIVEFLLAPLLRYRSEALRER